jgi:hypothetical protein
VPSWFSDLNRPTRYAANNHQPVGYDSTFFFVEWHICLVLILLNEISLVIVSLTLNSFFPGPDNLDNLRRLAEQFQKQSPGVEGGTSGAAAQDDDDDVPDLVPGETFEEAAEEKKVPEAEEKKE